MRIRLAFLAFASALALAVPTKAGSVPDWMVDGLNTIYDAMDNDRWHDNPGLATQGCMLKRKSRSVEEARTACERAFELSPTDPETLFKLGMFRRAEKRMLDAFYLLRDAAKQGHAEAMVWAAVTILSRNPKAARVWASRAVEEHPDEPTGWTASCLIEAALYADRSKGDWSRDRVAQRCAQAQERDGESEMYKRLHPRLQQLLR